MSFKLPQLPSIVWVFIFIGGIIALIGSIIAVFILLATVPGVASALFLIPGFIYVFSPKLATDNAKVDSFARAIGVGFFALMGMAIDQPGNFIYNYPFRYFCPENTELNREVDVTHPLPGRTDMTQDFQCIDGSGKVVNRIGMGTMIGVRFFEYLILAYLLIGLKDLKEKSLHTSKQIAAAHKQP